MNLFWAINPNVLCHVAWPEKIRLTCYSTIKNLYGVTKPNARCHAAWPGSWGSIEQYVIVKFI
jgi:hypothetical protein